MSVETVGAMSDGEAALAFLKIKPKELLPDTEVAHLVEKKVEPDTKEWSQVIGRYAESLFHHIQKAHPEADAQTVQTHLLNLHQHLTLEPIKMRNIQSPHLPEDYWADVVFMTLSTYYSDV